MIRPKPEEWEYLARNLFHLGNQIEDILQVPESLGSHSRIVIAQTIAEFRAFLIKAKEVIK